MINMRLNNHCQEPIRCFILSAKYQGMSGEGSSLFSIPALATLQITTNYRATRNFYGSIILCNAIFFILREPMYF